MALAVCLAAGFMTLLDVSIVNVALPSIEQGLHAQSNELEWIVAGYALSLGCCSCRRGASATRTAGGRCSWSAWRCSWSRARPARWRRRRSCSR
jgi:MFS family permease